MYLYLSHAITDDGGQQRRAYAPASELSMEEEEDKRNTGFAGTASIEVI